MKHLMSIAERRIQMPISGAPLMRSARSLSSYLIASAAVLSVAVSSAMAMGGMTKADPPSKMCDEGYFILGDGQKLTFEDVIIEANRIYKANESGKVTVYGYIGLLELPSDPMERTDAKLFGGENCYSSSVSNNSMDIMIDLLVDPASQSMTEEKYKEIRRIMLRSVDNTQGTALLKITGSFGLYNNTYRQYFEAEEIEVVATGEN